MTLSTNLVKISKLNLSAGNLNKKYLMVPHRLHEKTLLKKYLYGKTNYLLYIFLNVRYSQPP